MTDDEKQALRDCIEILTASIEEIDEGLVMPETTQADMKDVRQRLRELLAVAS